MREKTIKVARKAQAFGQEAKKARDSFRRIDNGDIIQIVRIMPEPRFAIPYMSEEKTALGMKGRERIIAFGKETAKKPEHPPKKTQVRWMPEDFKIQGEALGRAGTDKDFQEAV